MSIDLRLIHICPSMCGVVNLGEKLKPCSKGQLHNFFSKLLLFTVHSGCVFCSFSDLSDRHREVMGAVKSQLESSHQEELNELTASFLADSAIKVESARLETEHEWQEKLDSMKQKHEEDVQALNEKLSQVSRN